MHAKTSAMNYYTLEARNHPHTRLHAVGDAFESAAMGMTQVKPWGLTNGGQWCVALGFPAPSAAGNAAVRGAESWSSSPKE